MIKNRVSVVIPSRNEQFLHNTIQDLLKNSRGDLEIIAILDGYWPPADQIIQDPRVKYLHRGESRGMRNGITSGVDIATGEFIMKIDGHCMLDEGFDTKLIADCDRDWVVVPRRKRLDAENWCIQDVGKPDIDYMYLSYPDNPSDFGGSGINGKVWEEKNRDPKLKEILIDDLMSSQGSMWFMHKDYFHYLELMNEKDYGTFWNEFQEIGLNCWLSGGRVVVNKKTWYAHLHKGKKFGRGYFLDEKELIKGATHTKLWLTQKNFTKQIYDLAWLIEKFWPVPTWPEDKSLWLGRYKIEQN